MISGSGLPSRLDAGKQPAAGNQPAPHNPDDRGAGISPAGACAKRWPAVTEERQLQCDSHF